ncbi:MAG: hypothetical protein ACHQUC_02635 [Chlamydiales bacterium]
MNTSSNVSAMTQLLHLSLQLETVIENQGNNDKAAAVTNILIRSVANTKEPCFEIKDKSICAKIRRFFESIINFFRATKLYDIESNLNSLNALFEKANKLTPEERQTAIDRLSQKEKLLLRFKYTDNPNRAISEFIDRIDAIKTNVITKCNQRKSISNHVKAKIDRLRSIHFPKPLETEMAQEQAITTDHLGEEKQAGIQPDNGEPLNAHAERVNLNDQGPLEALEKSSTIEGSSSSIQPLPPIRPLFVKRTTKEDIPEIEAVLRNWRILAKSKIQELEAFQSIQYEKKYKAQIDQFVNCDLQSLSFIHKINDPTQEIYVCVDEQGNIQGLSMVERKHEPFRSIEDPYLYVRIILTNPNNIRSPVNTNTQRVEGAGTIIIYTLAQATLGIERGLYLNSIRDAIGFYQNKLNFCELDRGVVLQNEGGYPMVLVAEKIQKIIAPIISNPQRDWSIFYKGLSERFQGLSQFQTEEEARLKGLVSRYEFNNFLISKGIDHATTIIMLDIIFEDLNFKITHQLSQVFFEKILEKEMPIEQIMKNFQEIILGGLLKFFFQFFNITTEDLSAEIMHQFTTDTLESDSFEKKLDFLEKSVRLYNRISRQSSQKPSEDQSKQWHQQFKEHLSIV